MIKMLNGQITPLTDEEIAQVELKNKTWNDQAYERKMADLRQQRNQLLQQSDWMAVADRTMTQAQIDYRQALRDLPANSTPALDENGNLTGVEWPVYSEEA